MTLFAFKLSKKPRMDFLRVHQSEMSITVKRVSFEAMYDDQVEF